MRTRKGFTLVELLVVIAIIALLMGILMPALARVRQIAYRMVCGTNLSGIGKAMLIYSNDYDEEYPIAGGKSSEWDGDGVITAWDGTDTHLEKDAFGAPPGASATITSSLYLLVKFADVTPKQFICKGDTGVKEFKLSDMGTLDDPDMDITEAWDFGDDYPGECCSYSYHMPYYDSTGAVGHPINVSSNPGCPVAGDRNPYLDKNADSTLTDTDLDAPDWVDNEYKDPDKKGNAAPHQHEGQNVLFNDFHVNFEKWPNCGIENDNIWKYWATDPPTDPEDRQLSDGGEPTEVGAEAPMSEEDAFLVNETQGGKVSTWQ